MLVLQTNLVLSNPDVHKHVVNLLAAIEPPVFAKPFESVDHLAAYLSREGQPKRQILITDSAQSLLSLNRKGHFTATVLLGESQGLVSSSSVCEISQLPSSEELVDAIQTTYRIADQFFKLQSNTNKLAKLAERERRIIELAVEGTPNKAIASKLGISIKTVEKIRRNAYSKLNVTCAAEMASLVTFNRFCLFSFPMGAATT